MRIFCKEKDYYDYLQIHDDDIIFDRRKSIHLSDKDIIRSFPTYDKRNYFSKKYDDKNLYQVLALRAGYKLFFFKIKISNFSECRTRGKFLSSSEFDYEVNYLGSKLDYTYKDDPLNFFSYDVEIGRDKKWNIIEADPIKDNINNLKCYPLNYDSWHNCTTEYNVPFIGNTFVAKYISGDEIYNAIDDYLRSLNNDVDQESEGITDVDKAINHGFDKRSSFRNIKD